MHFSAALKAGFSSAFFLALVSLTACSSMQSSAPAAQAPAIAAVQPEEPEVDELTLDLEASAPDEMVEEPQLPPDDGLPLSQDERIALHSVGELDARLSMEDKRLMERHFKYYLHDNREQFERFLVRSAAYLPYVKERFRERGVPEEIAYLAIVESGFNPNAVSRAGATGMWQFMRFTGRLYGLEQSTWLDERRDPFKATDAAASYLLKLYDDFDDWLLAIAAYNAGEGKIGRAMQSTGAEDFFELCRLNPNIPSSKMRLKPETQQYVPRFLAVCKIMRNLEVLGFTPPDPGAGIKVVKLEISPGTDLGSLARHAGLEWDTFSSLNPAFRRSISSPSGKAVAYVPEACAPKATAWMSRPESRIFAGWKEYRVRKGDTVFAVAQRHGISADVLRQANRLRSNQLRVGAALLVPGSAKAAAQVKVQPVQSSVANKTVAARGKQHVVRQGENLYAISRQYGLSVAALQAANGMSSSDTALSVGQKLNVPVAQEAARSIKVAENTRGNVFIVQQGDTLYDIAQKNNTSVDALIRLNGLKRGRPLQPGQELRLP